MSTVDEQKTDHAIEQRLPKYRDALGDLASGTHTVKEIALRLGVSPDAVRMLRHRFERATGKRLPRYETRGRKPAPLQSAAA